ncbi:MAG TPA: carboxypeptidase-like regulatory domain-containing protein, partial [Puia sp.]|nr:carboxypeptidase-like regulatory domain-containing protein [Puia sp.]
MQLTGILLFIAVLQVGATGRAQTVTYSARSAPLVQVLRAIEQQTGYHPFYNDADLSGVKPVTVELKAVPLREALDAVLKGQPLTYEIQGNTIDLVRRVNGIPPLGSSISAPVLSDIRGRVVDSTGAPIAGASVLVKGTQRGAATDAKGEFVIKGVEGGVTLVVTYTGFEPRQYKYSGQAGVVILLERSTSPLDQVQVIAYGTTTQRLNIGNVGSVSAEEIERQPVNNPLLALDGRVPGLFITQATGLPGGGVTVRIQGQNSINGGNDP